MICQEMDLFNKMISINLIIKLSGLCCFKRKKKYKSHYREKKKLCQFLNVFNISLSELPYILALFRILTIRKVHAYQGY